jgi:hypothetical protein
MLADKVALNPEFNPGAILETTKQLKFTTEQDMYIPSY